MNHRGQVLWLFVFVIPLILSLIVLIVDIGNLWYFSNKLNNINHSVIRYGLKNIEKEELQEYLVDLIYQNDEEINNHNVDITEEMICIAITKEVNSYFGKITGETSYQLESNYCGHLSDNKIVIEKGSKNE